MISREEFNRCLSAAQLWCENATTQEETDYLHAYRFGLRRHYHGEHFGSEGDAFGFANRCEASRAGFHDGLAGKMCDFARLQGYTNLAERPGG